MGLPAPSRAHHRRIDMKLSLSDLFFDRAARDPDRTAILGSDETISYGALAREAAGVATLLRDEGFGDSTLTLLLPNLPRFPALLHGVLAAGGTASMCNPLNSPREVAEQVHDSGATAAITTAELRTLLPPGVPAIVVDELPGGLTIIRDQEERWVPLPQVSTPPDTARGGEAPAAILFTAADRGRARGAVLSHRNLIANLRSTMEMMRLTEEDRVVAVLPLIHAFGLTVSLNAPLAVGATVIPVERYHPVRMLERISTTGTTVFAGVPAMFSGILSVLERTPVPEHALRLVLSGGAPIRPGIQAAWESRFGVPLRQGYGLTEASPVCLFNTPDRPARPGTLGVEIPRVRVEIHDAAGRPLPAGEVGELCVQGENVFSGYLDGDPHGAPRDGWLRTGDLATRDEEGFVRFVGLLKPMFTRSGFNVYPREIERVLEEDPRVSRAIVTAQPDTARENEVILEVEVADASLTADEVKELCRTRLAAYKQPGRIVLR